MSFHITAVGTATECAAQLASQETDNVLGARLAEVLVELLGDPDGQPATYGLPGEYRYVVKLTGHSGGDSAVYLDAKVEAHWIAPVVAELAKEIEAEDGAVVDATIVDHQADVLAAIDHFRGSLGFAAPELHDEKWDLFRSQVAGIFAPDVEIVDDEDDEDED